MTLRLRVCDAELALLSCSTRLPFRFGVSTLTFAPLATLRVTAETEAGERTVGYASDLLVPKWFEKNPSLSIQDDVDRLLDSTRYTMACARESSDHATVFDHWWRLQEAGKAGDEPALVRGLGVSLMERALIDAACRVTRISFFEALRGNLFGFEPGRVAPELTGWDLASSLPAQPASRIRVRHTVGLLDALREQDVDEPVSDGLPESLEADIERYGLRYFKLKLSGDRDHDLVRLERIADVLSRTVGETSRFTIDGNEQFADLAALADLFDAVASCSWGPALLRGLLFVEQPLARDHTFDAAANTAMSRVADYAPVIIDEADDGPDALPRAAELGYRGISIKNCKGVFRALVNHGRCGLSDGLLFQSAEDLTNLPVVALQQDLATVAALGVTHVERNGHHYFHGLDHLPSREVDAAVADHGDLYEAGASSAFLRIEEGQLSIGSLQGPGYGTNIELDWSARTPADEWSWPS